MRKFAARIIVGALACAGAASAGPLSPDGEQDAGPSFYNRPGASQPDVELDLASCLEFAGQAYAGTSGPGLGILGAALAALSTVGPMGSLIDDCMISRGYRRFTVNDRNNEAFDERFSAMTPADRNALFGSETPPEGELRRQWQNSFWLDEPASAELQARRFETPIVARRQFRPLPGVSLNAHVRAQEGAITLQDGEALVLVSVRSVGAARAARVEFAPVQSLNPSAQAGPRPGPGIEVEADRSGPTTLFAYVIPAGAYALNRAGLGVRRPTEFCFGTAGFEAEPGDVLYLGDVLIQVATRSLPNAPAAPFAIRVSNEGLETARARLSDTPELAQQLRPVRYVNGVQSPCALRQHIGEYGPVYGFDLPDAPWVGAQASDATSPATE